ncbi:hypothetical protein QMK61_15985 [Fulvimonas sp. R45]|uniref:hypothetical protein n=1 Tax=Fulvimonas sp. R45 TaxID=3045937 RepID=UPI00265E8566|nr:hypothetical protein [Fulvimonas sp. R45]MDO1530338.1 hypothetical protein [Fulvimonas sp. R45]
MDRQDINYGVDFERAREHLDAEAGRLFRVYLTAKKSGTSEEIEQARTAYEAAHHRAQTLRPSDDASIRAVLEE